ncbi:flagellar protein FliT [Pseudomaricurvus alkylphenolicus]|jgi:hypothetical protein|uniref:flagellar protein FliT n=1 Tax=Pseudomaricurvus alkylphenolicus TaxID=1306991 RepID=UPI0014247413|nr:flagellar protein FliT [Pseudomaricurvus alkylphenolicus]NIB43249.1 flagellar protein FliT [Pseudomaricurvus alkylphenolicus]
MPTSPTEHLHRIESARGIYTKICEAIENEEWAKAEELIEQRTTAIERAFVADLPESTHEFARQAFAEIRRQESELMERAKDLQSNAGRELAQLRRNKNSIDAYKLD